MQPNRDVEDVRLVTLDRLGDWRLHIGIWGYAIIGDVLEQDALMGEYRDSYPLWDRTSSDLATSFRDRGSGWERVPDWHALHHLPMRWREEAL